MDGIEKRRRKMKLKDFCKVYEDIYANAVTILGYCSRQKYEYIYLEGNKNGKNEPRSLNGEPFWLKIKNKKIKNWAVEEIPFSTGIEMIIILED